MSMEPKDKPPHLEMSNLPAGLKSRKTIAVNISLGIMLLGVLMVCQPFVHLLFQYGFIVTIAGIVAFSFAGHMKDD